MTDRELLELAAKAAGAERNGYRYGENGREPLYGMSFEVYEGIEYRPWNPLKDDGDALRLAVKLGLIINNRHDKVLVENHRQDRFWQPHGDDEEAATRRAIVRAAAEIGKRP